MLSEVGRGVIVYEIIPRRDDGISHGTNESVDLRLVKRGVEQDC